MCGEVQLPGSFQPAVRKLQALNGGWVACKGNNTSVPVCMVRYGKVTQRKVRRVRDFQLYI